MQAGRLTLEHRQKMLRLGVSWIASWNEDRIDTRQFFEYVRPLVERELHLLRIAVVGVQRRIPDPDVHAVLVRDARHLTHHVDLGQRKMRTVSGVVRPRRD